MSNLSDLLPAGASAKQLTFTDSGSGISSKAPVVLNSDGTVSSITGSAQSIGTADTAVSASVFSQNAAYDSNSNRIVVVYRDANPWYGKAVVGTPSGTSISWGTPVAFQSSSTTQIGICFDSTENKIVIVYSDLGASQYGKAIVGDVSGSTISFGSAVTFYSGTTSYSSAVYDTSNSKVVVAYHRSTGYADVATVSGTTISFGTAVQFTANNPSAISTVFDSSANKVIISYADNTSSGAGTSVVGTVSGTTMSFGSAAVWNSGDSGYQNSAYDASADRTLICYRDDGDSQKGKGVVAQVSGTSLTYGSETELGTTNIIPVGMAYDPDGNQVLVAYGSGNDSYKGKFRRATVSGLTVSFSEEFEYLNGTDGGYIACVYNTTDDKGVIIFKNDSASSYTQSVAVTLGSTNLTAQAFVGVADSAISASAAGSVIVQGGTVSGPTTDVAVPENVGSNIPWGDASKANSAPTTAYGNNDVLIAYYINDGVTVGARVVAGTIGGGTISFGTDAVISADASVLAYYYGIAYDSTNDTYIVSWFDHNDSSKLYAAVVSLTGNSISFGGTTAIVSTANVGNAQTLSAVYDPDTQRVIFTYCSAVDTYAYAVVCEASSTAITTVGTPAKIDSSSANNGYANRIAACYDPTEDKIIATYCYYGGGGTYYLRAAAGTVTGGVSNSISWGSSVPVLSQEGNYPYIAYNATDQRVVFNYQDATGTGYLTSSVASVSGTTITVGSTASVILTGTNYYPSVVHDATANKMVSYFRGSLSYAYVASGAINTATDTITYSTPTQVTSASLSTQNLQGAVYDPTIGKCILVSAGNSVGETACSIYTTATTLTDQPLTTGTKYFVTTEGKFSTTADTPSVNAGLAISTTSLLLNGDS